MSRDPHTLLRHIGRQAEVCRSIAGELAETLVAFANGDSGTVLWRG
jgi:hypothetical protein